MSKSMSFKASSISDGLGYFSVYYKIFWATVVNVTSSNIGLRDWLFIHPMVRQKMWCCPIGKQWGVVETDSTST